MLDLYWAVRRAIYKKTKQGHRFADGIYPYSERLGRAMVNFERQNRGHRHLLNHPELSVFATESRLAYKPLNLTAIRQRVSDTVYALFQQVVHAADTELPDTVEMQDILGARDTRNYIAAYSQMDLREYVETIEFTARKSFSVRSLRLEHGMGSAPHTLHLRLDVDGLNLRRSITLSPGSFHTLGGARRLLQEAQKALDELLDDLPNWPELQTKPAAVEDVITAAPAKPVSGVIVGPATRQRLQAARDMLAAQDATAVSADSSAAPAGAPDEDFEASARQIEEDAALLARLSRDLNGFVSVYTPEARAFLAANWDLLRSVVAPK